MTALGIVGFSLLVMLARKWDKYLLRKAQKAQLQLPLLPAAGKGSERRLDVVCAQAHGATTNFQVLRKRVGTYALGLVGFMAMLALPIIIIYGGIWIGEKMLPWLMLLSILALVFCIIILGPLALNLSTRPWAGLGFVVVSYVFGLTGWLMGLLLTWILWGGLAVVIGLLVVGIGVVPIAMLATLLNGRWAELGILVLAIIMTFGLRLLGAYLIGEDSGRA